MSSPNQAQTRAVAREDRMSRSRSLVVPGSILEDTILIYYHDPDLLFCVAEEAKPVSQFAADQGHHGDMSELGWIDNANFGYQFTPEALREVSTGEDWPALFHLAESNVCPGKQERFKIELQDRETFKSDFIDASKEQC